MLFLQCGLTGEPFKDVGLFGMQGPLLAAAGGPSEQFNLMLRDTDFARQPFAQSFIGRAINRRRRKAYTQGAVMPADQFGFLGIGRYADVQNNALSAAFAIEAKTWPVARRWRVCRGGHGVPLSIGQIKTRPKPGGGHRLVGRCRIIHEE